MAINQNVPTLRGVGQQQRLPAEPDLRQQQPVLVSRRFELSRHARLVLQRPAQWGHYRVSYTLSKSMNNVGEAFFSSPIDPSDCRRTGPVRTTTSAIGWPSTRTSRRPTDARRSLFEHLTHGLQLSGMLQTYSALPINITSGVTTIQGTTGRPIVDGAIHRAERGKGHRVPQSQPSAEPRSAAGSIVSRLRALPKHST